MGPNSKTVKGKVYFTRNGIEESAEFSTQFTIKQGRSGKKLEVKIAVKDGRKKEYTIDWHSDLPQDNHRRQNQGHTL